MDIAGTETLDDFLPTPKKRRGNFKPYDINSPEAEQLVYDFASFGVPVSLIGKLFGVTPNTIYNRYGDTVKLAHAESDVILHKAIWKLALDDKHKAQATMLIWLSKNRLGWTDNTSAVAMKDDETGEVKFSINVLEGPKNGG